MSSSEEQNRRDFADVMDFFGGTPVGPRPVQSRPYYSSSPVPSGPFDDLIRDAAARYGVRDDVARAMAYRESGFNPRAVGTPIPPAGDRAKGLYQFRDMTAAEEGIDPFDPAQATDAAVKRLRRHLDAFGGRYDLAVAAHIMGPDGVARSGGQFTPEVSQYVSSILGTPQDRTASDFEDVMSFVSGPATQPEPPVQVPPMEAPPAPQPTQAPQPATVEPEPSGPLPLPPLQRATPRPPRNLPELMAMPKEARERYMAERGTPVMPPVPPPTPGEKVKQAAISALRVPPEFVASLGESLGILAAGIDNFATTAMRPGGPVFVKPNASGGMPTDTSFQGEVARALKDQPNLKPEDIASYKIGQIIRDWTEKNLPNDQRLRNSFLYTVLPQAVSSTLVFWGVGEVAGPLVGTRLAIAGAGAAFQGPQGYREAVSAGADPDTAMKAAYWNMVAGSTEVVGLEAVLGNHGVPKSAIDYVTRALISGVDEGGQEFGQQVFQNLVARNLYDPNRGWNDGTIQATGAGGVVGVLMSIIQNAALGTRARRMLPQTTVAPGAPGIAPTTETMVEPTGPTQADIATANRLFAKQQLAKLVDEAERVGARLDSGAAGPNDAAKMGQLMQDIQRLSAEAGVQPIEVHRETPEFVDAVQKARGWMPWITQEEIAAQTTVDDLDRLTQVANSRREAAREKRILERATPNELAAYNRPGAPQKLILKAIEDRIAVTPPSGQEIGVQPTPETPSLPVTPPTTEELYWRWKAGVNRTPEGEVGPLTRAPAGAMPTEVFVQAAPSKTAPGATVGILVPSPTTQEGVPTEAEYQGAAEKLRKRLAGPTERPVPGRLTELLDEKGRRIGASARGEDLIGHETVDQYIKTLRRKIEEAKASGDTERLKNLEAALAKRTAPPTVAPTTPPAPAERRAGPAREIDLTNVRPEVAAFATEYVKSAGKTPFPSGEFNRDEERLLADAIDEAAKRRPPAPGQNVFLTPEEQEYVKKFREAKGRGEPTPPIEPPPPKKPTGGGAARKKRLATMEAKLPHWMSVVLEQGAISRDSLMRTYVGEDPSKPGYKESLATFNEIIAGLNKNWGRGLVVTDEGGMRLDEAAQMAAEKGFAGGDAIEARNEILRIITDLSGKKAPKVSGKRKGFGKIDPELAPMTRDVPAGDLVEGESFTTGDGEFFTVTKKSPGKITLANGPEGQAGTKIIELDEFDLVPIAGRMPRAYETGGGPREMAGKPKVGDPFSDADTELKQLLFTAGTYQVAKGATTQEKLQGALTKEFGGNVEQYVPGLWRLLTRLPGMQRFINVGEVQRGREPAGGVPEQQRPGGAQPGGRVPATGGPGPGERGGGLRAVPPPAPPRAPIGQKSVQEVVPTLDRTQTDRGVATVSRELLPELTGIGKKFHTEYSTPERLAELEKKFGGKRPMKHQVEQAARAVMAFANGHAYVNSDGTGTGKTLTTGIVIDSILRDKPDARIMLVARNPGIMKQWQADVLGPMGLKTHEIKAQYHAGKGIVNFATYTRLQILHGAGNLELIKAYHPDLLIFDESHALKNFYTGFTASAVAGEQISSKDYAERVLFLSATPFESILHTGYLTRANLWQNWRQWLEKTMGIRFNPEKERWEGLTPAKVRKLHEALVSQGRMGKNEIDFKELKNSSGQPITLTSENVMVPLTEENAGAYSRMNAVFDNYLEEALMNNDRAKLRMLRGIQHFFRRSYDEAHKLPAAIDRARKDAAAGKTVLFFLLRKNDSSVEKWWNRYEEDPDRYPAGSKMPELLEGLKRVQPPIAVPSPVKLIEDAFPQAVKITGDETAGGLQREKNIKALMSGESKVGIITIAAGAEALNLQDKIGTHPRVSYIVSTPYTASSAKQVMGRAFRLGSESSAEILWLFNDTPSDRRIATNMAWLSRLMGAAVSGEVENPNSDDLERFMFPELDKNGSNGGTARELADDVESSDRLILESPPDPKTGKPNQKEMFPETPKPASQEELLRQRRLQLKRKMIEAKTAEPIQWEDDTLFGAEEKKDIERRQGQIPGTEPKPRDMAGAPQALRVPGRPTKPSGRPWLWTIWNKLGVGEKERIKSRNEMLNDYLRAIGLKSHIGRMGMISRNIRARYWPKAQYSRRRTANDIGAAVHESGHYLDEILFGLDPSGDLGSVSNKEMQQFRKELLPLATPSAGRDPLPEGLAEFVRMYITENQKAQSAAPKFYPWFEARMQADPRTAEILEHFHTLKGEYEKYSAADWKDQFGSMFRTTYGVTDRVGAATTFRRIHRALYNSATMATWLEKKAARSMGVKPEQLPTEWRPSKVFGALPSRFQTISNFLEDGAYHPGRPGETTTVPGLLKIADLIHDKWRDFEMYTTALRAKGFLEKGENVEETIGIKKEWVDQAITEFGKDPKFRRAAALLQKYRGSLLEYMEWGGLINAKQKAHFIKNEPDYRPLLRLMEEDLMGRPGQEAAGARVAGLSTGLYRRKGSTRDIMPIFEAYQRMTFLAIDRSERNMAARSLINMAEGMPGGGELIHRVPMQEYPVHLSLEKVKQRLVQAGVDPKLIDDALAEHSMTMYVPSWMQPKAPYDWVWKNGKRELYYFDPDMYRLVEGMDRIQSNVIYRFFGSFARMHRGGIAVYNPVFWIRQIFPQLLSTAVQSGGATKYAAELPRALVEQLRRGPEAQKYERAFTGMSTYMRIDPRALSKLLALKMLRATGEAPRWWANPMNIARYAMAYSARIGMAMEHTPRQAEAAVAGLREAKTRGQMMEVGERARESDIDFSRQGWITSWITGISSFFAPYMIGQERVAREVREHPLRLAWRMNVILTPLALAVWAWNRRDDENEKQWRQTPRFAKDNNWIVHHPDPTQEPFQFRLPHMYGWWVSGIWAALDKMADKDPETYRLLARDIVQDLNPIPRLAPNVARPELEIWANENLYTGRPVYPEGRLPEYTYWPWTTQSAIDLGRELKVPPAILEYEAKGKLGTLGQEAFRVADLVRGVEKPGGLPAHATPFFGEFRSTYPRSTGEYVNRFYDVFKQAELVYRTGRLPELLLKGETGQLFTDRADALRVYASGKGLAAALSGFNRMLSIIEANPNMNAEEKRARQEDIYRQKNEMAERWWRSTMRIQPSETGRGMIKRVLGVPEEEARP